MMFGSILYNLWAALFSFTVYFLWSMQQVMPLPFPVIGKALFVAIIGFTVMFPIRYFLAYILYTPQEVTYSEEDVLTRMNEAESLTGEELFIRPENASTAEFQDGSTEEIAQVVRTMLHKQDEAISN